MLVVAGLWISIGLPALVLIPLAIERGRSPAWGWWALLSYLGLVVGLVALFSMQPAMTPVRAAYARYRSGEISADEYLRIHSAISGQL
ncbi:MAG TPA: hypothetical protein VFY90_06790 [Tepidiformaceae bacterium]|nr:hypothetical protein [Tepidiformaceae bacterium]